MYCTYCPVGQKYWWHLQKSLWHLVFLVLVYMTRFLNLPIDVTYFGGNSGFWLPPHRRFRVKSTKLLYSLNLAPAQDTCKAFNYETFNSIYSPGMQEWNLDSIFNFVGIFPKGLWRDIDTNKIRLLSSIDGVTKSALRIRLAEFGQKSRFRLAAICTTMKFAC